MKKFLFTAAAAACVAIIMPNCSTSTHIMQMENNRRLNLNMSDFELSSQVTGEATVRRILWVDWRRLFTGYEEGYTREHVDFNISVYGGIHPYNGPRNDYYAYYDMMQANPGYDVVFYPQVERKAICPILGMCFLFSTTTVKATARLGKLKQ